MSAAIDRVHAALIEHGSKRDGDHWQCPFHEDHTPSLHVTNGDGKVLLHCLAGCSTDEVLAALGLSMRDLFDDDDSPTQARSVEAEYDYTEESGELLFQVVRFAPKDFRQRRPDATSADGWAWSIKDVRRVLYRLPEVIEAVREGRVVWVVEGEKDVHALESAGEVATCNAGGAGKWRDEYAEDLRGAEVVIVADKDEPGRKHAEQVRRSLEGVAASVRVVEAAVGKDAADHLAAGHNVDDFVDADANAERGSDAPFVRASDVAERRIEWLWYRRLPTVGIAVLVGDGGVGKSTVIQKIGSAMTTGAALPFGGKDGPPRGVLMLSAEEDTGAVIRLRMRLMGADLDRVLLLDPEHGAEFTLPSGIDVLDNACGDINAGMVVIDSGPAFMDRRLKTNDEADIRRMLRPLAALAERRGLLVVVLCHINKGQGSPGQRIMGGAAWRNAPRLVLMAGVPDQQHPSETDQRMLVVEKSNLGRFPAAVGFRLATFADNPDLADVAWGQEHQHVTAGDLVTSAADPEKRHALDEAVDWLSEALGNGSKPASELLTMAREDGIAERTLRRASKRLGVTPAKSGFNGGDGRGHCPKRPTPPLV
jgi:putative DNA primase/helicase